MARKNQRHQQPYLISRRGSDLPEKLRKRLDDSWAGVFYRETLCRLDESPLAAVYANTPSRPNLPVNVFVALESLKADYGWSDEELYDHFSYDMQVRYAVGYHQFGEGDFDLRSLYYFRERVARYMQEEGVNLIEKAFEQITDEQTKAFKLKTGKQRMDSTQIASNIREMSRLQLLVEVLQRVHRMLTPEDQTKYVEAFAAYILGHAGQYVYHIKGEDTSEHLQKIGELMQRLLADLQPNYAQDPVYQMLERVFGEHFRMEEKAIEIKVGRELSPSSLQSPDDEEIWLRFVNGRALSIITSQFLEWCCTKVQAIGKRALVLLWDNASWHISQVVRTWIREYYQAVKRSGRGVRILVCALAVRSPWLNPIEPKWVHGKRRVVEADRTLSAQELADRICATFGCHHEAHPSIPENVT